MLSLSSARELAIQSLQKAQNAIRDCVMRIQSRLTIEWVIGYLSDSQQKRLARVVSYPTLGTALIVSCLEETLM